MAEDVNGVAAEADGPLERGKSVDDYAEEPLGEAPEDNSLLFLRRATPLLDPGAFAIDYGLRYTFRETQGFMRNEHELLGVLTDYLGTGAAFGLSRLQQTFVEAGPFKRKTHILIVSDSDLFREIDGTKGGWQTAKQAVENAGGGATAALNLRGGVASHHPWLEKLRSVGIDPHVVSSEAELVEFARAFSRRTYSTESSAAARDKR